jgi:uracil-DNA glycosylase
MTEFLSLFFKNCKRWFLEELQEVIPKIIITLGEPTYTSGITEYSYLHNRSRIG